VSHKGKLHKKSEQKKKDGREERGVQWAGRAREEEKGGLILSWYSSWSPCLRPLKVERARIMEGKVKADRGVNGLKDKESVEIYMPPLVVHSGHSAHLRPYKEHPDTEHRGWRGGKGKKNEGRERGTPWRQT